MWWNKWFKPTCKVGQEVAVKLGTNAVLAQKLLDLCVQVPVDRLYKDVVLRRYLLSLYWSDIQTLFDVLIAGRKITPTGVAVNLHNYFKSAGSLPSVCLERLAQTLARTEDIPFTVTSDVNSLIEQINHAHLAFRSTSED